MATYIPSIPTLTADLEEKIGFNFPDPIFFYIDIDEEGVSQEYQLSATDKYFHSLYDERAIWTPESKYGLRVKGKLTIENTAHLFGVNGIAPSNSTISIGLRWTSSQSRRRGTKHIQDIQISNAQTEFEYELSFPSNQLRGIVGFSIVLYLKESCVTVKEEEFLANTQGAIIGESEQYKLMLDGSEPDLAIEYTDKEEDKEKPLWFVTMSCQDPIEMPFDAKALTIWINKRHPDFKFVDQQNTRHFNPALLREIISNALILFVNSLRSEPDADHVLEKILNDDTDTPMPGSIAQTIIHFNKDLDMDFKNPMTTAMSIKNFIDNKLKKI